MRRFLLSMALTMSALSFLVTVGCADPAANAPDAVVSAPAPTPAPAAAAVSGTQYTISAEGSTVGFVGSKVTGSHEGGFKTVSGTITVVGADVTTGSVDVNIDTTSLWSDAEDLTAHLKSPDFFEVETYPTAKFTSTAIAAGTDGSHTVTGNLELHGVTKQISFPATITVGEAEVTAKAEFSIKRFDFGIVYAGKADNLIRDEVLIKLDLKATPAA